MNSQYNLPLSWQETSNTTAHFHKIHLGPVQWLNLAEIPSSLNLISDVDQHLSKNDQAVLLRGCSKSYSQELKTKGFESIQIGQEAVLDLHKNPFIKKSLSQLVKRGQRHGKVLEVSFNRTNRSKIQRLQKMSAYGNQPKLKHLFRTEFEKDLRCFVFQTVSGKWLGAITLSKNSSTKMHIELLTRSKDAPVGIMEALIYHIYFLLKYEGYHNLSLGEVPFVKNNERNNLKEQLVQFIGRRLNFAYNSKGLFAFKNKFQPQWQPVYICAKPGISYLTLGRLFIETNLLDLVRYKTLNQIKFF